MNSLLAIALVMAMEVVTIALVMAVEVVTMDRLLAIAKALAMSLTVSSSSETKSTFAKEVIEATSDTNVFTGRRSCES